MTSKDGPRALALRALREKEAKPVPRAALKKIVEAPAPMKKDRPAAAEREPKPEAPAPEPKETTMKTPKKAGKPAKKTVKKASPGKGGQRRASAKAPAKGKTRAPAQNAPTGSVAGSGTLPRPGSKNEIMFRMVTAPQGATEAAICKELGWVRCRVTLNRVCKKAGATLTSEGAGADRVYRATMPTAPSAS